MMLKITCQSFIVIDWSSEVLDGLAWQGLGVWK